MSLRTKITITIGVGLRKSGGRIGTGGYNTMLFAAKQYLLGQCGGFSVVTSEGGWRDAAVRDWIEPGIIITTTVVNAANAGTIAAHLRDIFDQKCVALETQQVEFELI